MFYVVINLTGQTHLEGITGLQVLLAEDNIINQKVGLRHLEKFGCGVDVANNGIEVLAALKERDYDIIFMDMRMPEMGGLEATRHIRAQSKEIPYIIALTANAMEKDRQACLEAGMQDFLPKPINLTMIKAALERYLGSRAPSSISFT